MIKVFFKANATDGQYLFAPHKTPAEQSSDIDPDPANGSWQPKGYANALKVGASDGMDVVMVYTDEGEMDYLKTCDGYLGDADQLKGNNPEIYNAIEPIIFAGETINDETEGE